MTGVLKAPDGSSQVVNFLDDGTGGDHIAEDGVYSAVIDYTMNGIYTVTVNVADSAGQAALAVAGQVFTPPPPGEAMAPPEDPIPSAASFARAASAQFEVRDVKADDHVDSGACTQISNDNRAISGRIDRAGDTDCFSFTPSSVTNDLLVRVLSPTGDMDAVVTVFRSDGNTEIATSASDAVVHLENRVIVGIPADELDSSRMIVTVAHADSIAGRGNYLLIVGPQVPIEALPQIDSRPNFGSASVGAQSWTAGQPVASFTVPAATGGDAPLTYTASGLPSGVSMAPSRVVSGTPSAIGSGTATVTVTDVDGDTARLTFAWTVDDSSPDGRLGNPSPHSFQSGIGVISGWVCDANRIEIEFNNDASTRQPAAYGTERLDTAGECGDTNNGFGLLVNWNRLGDGTHTVRALADGVEFGRATFTVTTLGEEFVRG